MLGVRYENNKNINARLNNRKLIFIAGEKHYANGHAYLDVYVKTYKGVISSYYGFVNPK